jgi:myo-inositol 2-dehydrogenase / D-chiro-inositol 1-dehydrogenase
MAQKARVRIGLIGAGRIGKRHGRTLAYEAPAAELVAVCDAFENSARALAEECRCDEWTTDADDIFRDPSIQAIVVASSTESHAPLITAAARAGKHVFCEKPIALDLEATDQALKAVRNADVQLQIGFQRRFDKGFAAAKLKIGDGEIGTVESIRDTMRDPEPPPRDYLATCGGLFRDMSIHDFDCVRWLMGDEVDEVFAFGANLVDPVFAEFNDLDTSIVSLRFMNGSLAVIDNSRRSNFGYDVRTEIFGSRGAIMVGYSRDTPLLKLSSNGVESDHVHWFLERFDAAYLAEIRAFIDCLQKDRDVPIDGDDGRAAMALAYAAEASIVERAPVKVSRFAAAN